MAESIVKLRVDATGATSALKGVQNQTNKLQQSFGGLQTAIAGLGIGLLAKQTVSTTANFQALQIRMKVLTSEFGEFAEAQELVRKAQDQFNLSIVEATKGITDIFARLRPLGVSLKDIETTFIGFNSIAKVAGLNATEASAAFTQLAQGLGSGRLQGDEFRSIAEQVPQLLKAISDETGIASGKLKDFASKGLLKSDVIIRALSKSAEGLGKQIRDIIDESPAEKFKQLNNELLELQLTIGSKLTPVLADSALALASLVEAVTNLVDSEVGQASAIIAGLALAVKGVSVVVPLALTTLINFVGQIQLVAIQSQIAASALTAKGVAANFATANVTKLSFALSTFKIALAKTGIGLAVIAFGALTTAILKTINAQKEFNRILDEGSIEVTKQAIKDEEKTIAQLTKRLENANPVLNFFSEQTNGLTPSVTTLNVELDNANKRLDKLKERLKIAKIEKVANDFMKTKEALQKTNIELRDSLERSKLLTDEAKETFDIEKQREEFIKKFGEAEADKLIKIIQQNNALKKQEDQIKKNQEATKALKEKFMEIGQSVEDGIVSNLADAVEGTKTLAQAAISVLNDLKRSLVEVAIQRAVSGLGDRVGGFLGDVFKNLGKRANGGPVSAGGAFVVGEKGPELLQMGSRGGNIIPNNQLGGSTTNIVNVSVDASGSAVSGNTSDAQQLGNLIGAAIQERLIKEKRSGGLLSR